MRARLYSYERTRYWFFLKAQIKSGILDDMARKSHITSSSTTSL